MYCGLDGQFSRAHAHLAHSLDGQFSRAHAHLAHSVDRQFSRAHAHKAHSLQKGFREMSTEHLDLILVGKGRRSLSPSSLFLFPARTLLFVPSRHSPESS